MKNLKVASYNVSGGFYIGNEDTEYLDRKAADTFDDKLLNELVETVNKEDIDILCIQEVITTPSVEYLKKISEKTNLKYYDAFELSPCNLVKNTEFGVAIMSKYKINSSKKSIFPNPKISKTTSSGNTYYLHDKGYIICDVEIENKNLTILTHQGFPFRRFNSTPEQHPQVFEHFNDVIKKFNIDIVTGDFNAENFMQLIPTLNDNYQRTINQVTTVDGKNFDDILINKNKKYNSKLIKLLSDHFMLITTINE